MTTRIRRKENDAMKKVFGSLCMTLLLPVLLAAQPGAVKVTDSQTAEGFALDAQKSGPGVWSVLVTFRVAGAPPTLLRDTVSVSRRFHLFSCEQASDMKIRRYGVQTALGDAWGKVDASVMYRLPYSVHKKDAVYSMAIDKGWPVHVFTLAQGDTVFAARRGTVVSVTEARDSRKVRGMEVVIQHPDGSWAAYRGLARSRVTVVPGDKVWADTPIGFAGLNGSYGYSVVMAVKYPTVMNDAKGYGKLILADLNPVFAIASSRAVQGRKNTYVWVPRISYEIITQEMTPQDMEAIRRTMKQTGEE